LMQHSEPVCTGYGENRLLELGRNQVWNFESAMSHKMSIFQGGIDGSYHVVCVLEMCWPIVVSFPPHTTYDDDNSEIFNSFTWMWYLLEWIPQQNCVESMPGALQSLKI
jgi:hypothetical protein